MNLDKKDTPIPGFCHLFIHLLSKYLHVANPESQNESSLYSSPHSEEQSIMLVVQGPWGWGLQRSRRFSFLWSSLYLLFILEDRWGPKVQVGMGPCLCLYTPHAMVKEPGSGGQSLGPVALLSDHKCCKWKDCIAALLWRLKKKPYPGLIECSACRP